MNIGFYAGHQHYIPHVKVLYESLVSSIPDASVTLVVKTEDQNAFNDVMNEMDLNVLCINNHVLHPFVDKVLAASVYESHISSDFLWLDVDSYFLQPYPTTTRKGIHVNPVDMTNIGILYGHELTQVWQIACDFMNVEIPTVSYRTKVSHELIYPYFNIGCVHIYDNKKVFTLTYESIIKLLEDDHYLRLIQASPMNGIFFHQVVLTLAVIKLYDMSSITPLEEGVNLPLHLMSKMDQKIDVSDLISIRYDTYFEKDQEEIWFPEPLKTNKDQLSMLWYY